MPATVHTDNKIEHYGERQFADKLINILGKENHLWFNVSGTAFNQIDCILVAKDVGVFVIEVKALKLHELKDVFKTNRDFGPVRQARNAMFSFLDYVKNDQKDEPPYMLPLAVYSAIERQQFENCDFSVTRAGDEFDTQGIVFADDLENEHDFLDRLREIVRLRKSFCRTAPNVEDDIDRFLRNMSSPRESQAELDRAGRIRNPENERGAALREYWKPSSASPVVIRGFAGTGKTEHLLRIGLEHAKYNQKVLLLTYNKVLAADLRRIAKIYSGGKLNPHLEFRHFHYFNAVMDGKKSEKLKDFEHVYDTVLVDEGQDLSDELFKVIDFTKKPAGQLFITYDREQALYSRDYPRLERLLAEAKDAKTIKQLNVVERSNAITSLFAKGFLKKAPKVHEAKKWVEKEGAAVGSGKTLRSVDDEEFQNLGTLPRIIYAKPAEEELIPVLDALIRTELIEAAAAGRPGSLIIMVLYSDRGDGSKAREYRAVRHVLDDLNVPYLDQIDKSNRLKPLPPGHVRLVTINSARGEEAERSIVLGLDNLDKFGAIEKENGDGDRNEATRRSIGYIALTRARSQVTIVTSPEDRSNYSIFAEALVARYFNETSARELLPGAMVSNRRQLLSRWLKCEVTGELRDRRVVPLNLRQDTYSHGYFYRDHNVIGDSGRLSCGDVVFVYRSERCSPSEVTFLAAQEPRDWQVEPVPGFRRAFVSGKPEGKVAEIVVEGIDERLELEDRDFAQNQDLSALGDLQIGDRLDVMCEKQGMKIVPLVAIRVSGKESAGGMKGQG